MLKVLRHNINTCYDSLLKVKITFFKTVNLNTMIDIFEVICFELENI